MLFYEEKMRGGKKKWERRAEMRQTEGKGQIVYV